MVSRTLKNKKKLKNIGGAAKKKAARSTRRRVMKSTSGKILPPIDVRKPVHFKELEKRIRGGPLTIVLVYADWCGHCHTMMPHFDKASSSPNRSIQSVKINESVLDSVNQYMNKNMGPSAEPISVKGYPSIILVDNKGQKVTDIEAVRDSDTMTKVMDNTANIANEAGIIKNGSVAKNESDAKNESVAKNESINKNLNATVSMTPPLSSMQQANNKKENSFKPNLSKGEMEETDIITSMTAPIMPPSPEREFINETEQMNDINSEKNRVIKGGNLYSSLASTAYTLAPTAVLLGIASKTLRRSKTRGRKIEKVGAKKGKRRVTFRLFKNKNRK